MKDIIKNKLSKRNKILFTILAGVNLYVLTIFGEGMNNRNAESALLHYLATFFFNIAIWSQIEEYPLKKWVL